MTYEEIIYSTKPDINKIPGGWMPEKVNIKIEKTPFNIVTGLMDEINGLVPNTQIINNAISNEQCTELINFMNNSPSFESVSIQGRKDIVDDRVGSIRTTVFSPELALELKKIFDNSIPNMYCNDFTPTDWWQNPENANIKNYNWKYIGISPMLRFMKYENHGQHYAHYDAGYIYPNSDYRTLLSFVLYLTTNEDGSTRIIRDNQAHLPIWERTNEDWVREVMDFEVIAKSNPVAGKVLIFPHRMCHDVEKYTGKGPRIIIRGDILFEKI